MTVGQNTRDVTELGVDEVLKYLGATYIPQYLAFLESIAGKGKVSVKPVPNPPYSEDRLLAYDICDEGNGRHIGTLSILGEIMEEPLAIIVNEDIPDEHGQLESASHLLPHPRHLRTVLDRASELQRHRGGDQDLQASHH